MGTKRLEKFLVDMLSEGEANTSQLFYAFNKADRNGTTMGQLSNVLGKRPLFVKVGHMEYTSIQGDRVRNDVWGLADA
jgi:hypothetical protein